MKLRGSNILITIILPVYLNISATNTVRYNPENIIQENPKISSDEFPTDERASIFNYYDAFISESALSEKREKILYDEHPLIISQSYKSVLLFIDLPPPEHKS